MLEAVGSFFDGSSAAKHTVTLRLDEARGVLSFDGDALVQPEEWPLAELRLLRDQPEGGWLTFARHTASEDETMHREARLSCRDGVMNAALRAAAPNLARRDSHKGTGARVVTKLTLAVVAVVAMIFVILPAMATSLAYMMPREREVQFGRAVVTQMEWFLSGSTEADLTCKNEAGLAALRKMEARLTSGREMEYALDIKVFDHEMVNAFAAPGGQIVIVRGLLDKATSADAVAGVLAHEIGHVENRDATIGALRAAGSAGLLSMVLGDFSGGTLAVLVTEHLISTSYTREAEIRADDFALEALHDAEVTSEGLASFFEYMLGLQNGGPALPAYLNTHPPSKERAEKSRSHAATQPRTTPVLTQEEWAALKAICD
ncbi:M48 family metallopeptidase [Lentibacter sp.]|uniref:M48 family metallopeptidase n=1 Tax=Lentibacter sp. TaxID=2024994 RepID=UPI003F6A3B93